MVIRYLAGSPSCIKMDSGQVCFIYQRIGEFITGYRSEFFQDTHHFFFMRPIGKYLTSGGPFAYLLRWCQFARTMNIDTKQPGLCF